MVRLAVHNPATTGDGINVLKSKNVKRRDVSGESPKCGSSTASYTNQYRRKIPACAHQAPELSQLFSTSLEFSRTLAKSWLSFACFRRVSSRVPRQEFKYLAWQMNVDQSATLIRLSCGRWRHCPENEKEKWPSLRHHRKPEDDAADEHWGSSFAQGSNEHNQ